MALKLKSLLVEQPQTERVDLIALNEILKMQQDIFTQALSKLNSIDYNTISEEAANMLKINASTLCEAYIEYCNNTSSTVKQHVDAELDSIVIDNTGTLLDRIENGLEY